MCSSHAARERNISIITQVSGSSCGCTRCMKTHHGSVRALRRIDCNCASASWSRSSRGLIVTTRKRGRPWSLMGPSYPRVQRRSSPQERIRCWHDLAMIARCPKPTRTPVDRDLTGRTMIPRVRPAPRLARSADGASGATSISSSEVKRMFVVVGEALVDLVGQRGGRTFSALPGGSPANVALGLARLGVPVTLNTRLGRNSFGEMVRSHLEASGVRVDGGAGEGAKTTLAIATLAAGIASYDFRIDWDVEALVPLPVETRCLHTGSLATVLPPGRANVVDLVEREHERGRVTVSYDPNVRPALLGDAARARPDIEHLVAMSDVVKVSDDDLRWLYPDRSEASM